MDSSKTKFIQGQRQDLPYYYFMELSERERNILNILLSHEGWASSSFIAEKCGISVRTLKSEISKIRKQLRNSSSITIESKPKCGYRVNDCDGSAKDLLTKTSKPDEMGERIIYVLRKLLVADYHIKIDDLSDELSVSRSVMSAVMKDVRRFLTRFDLKLTSKPGYGVLIEGTEENKRMAISEYFFHTDVNDVSRPVITDSSIRSSLAPIIKILNNSCDHYRIIMSDSSYMNLAIHIIVLTSRVKFYDFVMVDTDNVLAYQNTIEFKAASEIVNAIEKKNNLLLPIGETIYITQHIRCKRVLEETRLSGEETRKLENCLYVIFNEIENNFQISLSRDSELKHYLYLHIPPMIERLRCHMTIRNPLTRDNKRRYLFACKITHSACAVIEQIYNVKVDDNEFGYLLLYFNLAITKQEQIRRINVGFYASRGRSEGLMYINELQNSLSSKYRFTMLPSFSEAEHLDLLVTAEHLVNVPDSVPVYAIHNDEYLAEIEDTLNKIRYRKIDINKYIKPEFCYFGLSGETRDEVLDNFYKILVEKEIIREEPKSYNEFIYDELGNMTVHLQDSYRIVRKDVCFVCTLKHPVFWNTENVQVLVLSKTKRDNDKDLPILCRILSRWMNNQEYIKRVVKNGGYEQLHFDMEKLAENNV